MILVSLSCKLCNITFWPLSSISHVLFIIYHLFSSNFPISLLQIKWLKIKYLLYTIDFKHLKFMLNMCQHTKINFLIIVDYLCLNNMVHFQVRVIVVLHESYKLCILFLLSSYFVAQINLICTMWFLATLRQTRLNLIKHLASRMSSHVFFDFLCLYKLMLLKFTCMSWPKDLLHFLSIIYPS
jgi:hypothetical protein